MLPHFAGLLIEKMLQPSTNVHRGSKAVLGLFYFCLVDGEQEKMAE